MSAPVVRSAVEGEIALVTIDSPPVNSLSQKVVQGLVNAVPGPQGLECQVPCSFGTKDGKWQFTASAPGHAGRAVNVGAHYAVVGRGCPSYSDKGVDIRLNLDPAGLR